MSRPNLYASRRANLGESMIQLQSSRNTAEVDAGVSSGLISKLDLGEDRLLVLARALGYMLKDPNQKEHSVQVEESLDAYARRDLLRAVSANRYVLKFYITHLDADILRLSLITSTMRFTGWKLLLRHIQPENHEIASVEHAPRKGNWLKPRNVLHFSNRIEVA